MDILICCRRNHELEGNVEQPLEMQERLHQDLVQNENAAKQRQFFNAIQNMNIKGIQSFKDDEGFEVKSAKETPSEKEAFHFLAEIEDDAISSDEDFKTIFHKLLDAGCQINATDRFGNTPLMLAAEKGNSLVLKLLLDEKADPNKTNDAKNGPLHWASKNGKMKAIDLLLLYKANVNAQNKDYQTPLHLAVERDKKNAVRRLIAEDADTNLQDLKAKTPLEYASAKSMENLFCEKSSSVKDKKKKKTSSSGNDHDDDIDASDSSPLAYSDRKFVSDMDRCARRELTQSLCAQDNWKLLANELGIPSNKFGYYDRKDNPAEAILEAVCISRDLTVGELYNALVKCDLGGLGDQYL